MFQLLSTASLSKSLFSCSIQFWGSTLAIRVFVSMKPDWCCTQNPTFPSKNVCWFEALVDPNMCDRHVEQVKSACLHYPLLPPHPKKSHGAFSASSIMVVLRARCKETIRPKPRRFVKYNTLMRPCSEVTSLSTDSPQTSYGSQFHFPKARHIKSSGVNGQSWHLCPTFILYHTTCTFISLDNVFESQRSEKYSRIHVGVVSALCRLVWIRKYTDDRAKLNMIDMYILYIL